MQKLPLTRRDVLVGAIAAGLGTVAAKAFPAKLSLTKPKSFRVAHFCDMHIKCRGSARLTKSALKQAMALEEKPDILITGGDLIFDAMIEEERSVRHQWRLVKSVFSKKNVDIPMEHCIGNHDIWGVDRDRSKTTGNEEKYGKKWAMAELGMESPYRSFDQGGWHFIILDGTMPLPDEKRYIAELDDVQFDWLRADLQKTPDSTPVMIVSHEPILGVSVFFPEKTADDRTWSLPKSLMHSDAKKIVSLFEQHTNVKLCVSGHTHLVDRVDFRGVSYICNGAVSGAWWNGPYKGVQPGYGIVDLHPDGTFDHQYLTY